MAARAQTVAVVLLAAVAASSVGGCSSGGGTRAASPVSSTTSPPTTPGSTPSSPTPPRYVAATVGTADSPGDIASGFGSIWVVTHRGAEVDRIDPATNRVIAKIPSKGSELIGAAAGAGHVWYLDAGLQTVEGIDPKGNRVTVRTKVDSDGGGVTAGGGGVWFAGTSGKVVSIDSNTGRILVSRRLAPVGTYLSAYADAGRVWVVSPDLSKLFWLDPSTLRVLKQQHLEGDLGTVATGFGALWVGGDSGPLYRLDPHTGAVVRRIPLEGVASIAIGRRLLWVRVSDVELVGLNPRTGKTVKTYRDLPSSEVPGGGIVESAHALWVVNWTEGNVWRIATAL